MEAIKRLLSLTLHNSGILSFPFSTKNLTIITFHRIVSEIEKRNSPNSPMMLTTSQFKSIIQKIKKFTNPISLNEAYGYIKRNKKIPHRSVVVTFDDGYADNYNEAYPILKEYNIPATIFLATRYINQNEEWLWWDEIEYYFKQKDELTLPDDNENYSHEFITSLKKLNSVKENKKSAISQFIRTTMYTIAKDEKDRFISHIRDKINHSKKHLMLNWEQIIEMGGLIEFGSHTHNHYFLNSLSVKEIKSEFSQSKDIIEKNTNKKCQFVCYPAGLVNLNIKKIALISDYKAGVTTNISNNSEKTDLFSLNRKDAGYFLLNNGINESYFLYTLSSIYDLQAKISHLIQILKNI